MKLIIKQLNFLFYLTFSFALITFSLNAHAQIEAAHKDRNAGGMQVGDQAPNLIFKNERTNTYSNLESMRGKYVFVQFWASWCPCSLPHIPNYKILYDKYHDAQFIDANGFEIYSVSIDEDKSKWQEVVQKNNMYWPHNVRVKDLDEQVQTLNWNLQTVPTTYMVNPQGVIIAKNPLLVEIDATLSERSNQAGPRKLGRVLASATSNMLPQPMNIAYNSRNHARPTTAIVNPNQLPDPASSNRNYFPNNNNQNTVQPPNNPQNVEHYLPDSQNSNSYSIPNFANSVTPPQNTNNSTASTSNAPVIDASSFSELKVNVGEFYFLTQDHVDAVKDLGKLEVKNMPSGTQAIIIKGLPNHASAYDVLTEVHKRGYTNAVLTY